MVMRYNYSPESTISLDESLLISQCCRIDRELIFVNDLIRRTTLPSNMSVNRDPVVSQLLALRRNNELDDAIVLSNNALDWIKIYRFLNITKTDRFPNVYLSSKNTVGNDRKTGIIISMSITFPPISIISTVIFSSFLKYLFFNIINL